jgi:hypothetical protein
MREDPLRVCWRNMKKRCLQQDHKSYHRYGGRGISICGRWLAFENFAADMRATWFEGAWIERIDNDGNYEPNNCRWSTRRENLRNTSLVKLSEEKASEIRALYTTGEYSHRSLGRLFGVSHTTIDYVLRNQQWTV